MDYVCRIPDDLPKDMSEKHHHMINALMEVLKGNSLISRFNKLACETFERNPDDKWLSAHFIIANKCPFETLTLALIKIRESYWNDDQLVPSATSRNDMVILILDESDLGVHEVAARSEFGGYVVNNYSIMINGSVEFKPNKCLILPCRKKKSPYSGENVKYFPLDIETGEILSDDAVKKILPLFHSRLLPR